MHCWHRARSSELTAPHEAHFTLITLSPGLCYLKTIGNVTDDSADNFHNAAGYFTDDTKDVSCDIDAAAHHITDRIHNLFDRRRTG